MSKNGALLALLCALALAWGSTVFWKARSVRAQKAAQTMGAGERPKADLQWTPLEKQVLFNLDSLSRLKGFPIAASFLKDVDSHPLLRKALEQGMDPEAAQVFKSLVARYAAQPDFLRALEAADKGSAPSKDGCSSASPIPAKPSNPLQTETSEGCSPSGSLLLR